jgi:hypothetical protein
MPGLRITAADLTRSKPPRWAWQDRIVLGYLNLLVGNEKVGKGTLVAWILARLTRGDLPGDFRRKPTNVAVIGDEDSFDDVWTPRLHAAGADLPRVFRLDRPDGGYISFRQDRDLLVDVVVDRQIGVLYFDQLLDNLGLGVDTHNQKPLRDALGVMHPNKRADSFRQLVAGSPAFNAVSRSSLLVAEHPEDRDLRVLVRGAGNLSKEPKALEFKLSSHRFRANGYDFDVPLVTGVELGELTIDDLVKPDATTADLHSKIVDAVEIIEALLPRDAEWHPAADIYTAAEGEGIDERTVKRAKKRLDIEHMRTKTFPSSTLWRWLSGHADPRVARVPTVPTVPTANTLYLTSQDTQDTQDNENRGVPMSSVDDRAELARLRGRLAEAQTAIRDARTALVGDVDRADLLTIRDRLLEVKALIRTTSRHTTTEQEHCWPSHPPLTQ